MSVCLLESFCNVRLLFGMIARVSWFGSVNLQSLLREFSAGVLAKSFCKPSLFGCLGLPARLAKFFTLWVGFWANRFGVGCHSLPARFRDGFVSYVRCLACLNYARRFIIGVRVHGNRAVSLQVHAHRLTAVSRVERQKV